MLKLNYYMKKLNKTSQWLSDETGIPKKTIDCYRSETREPSFSNGLKISKALNVNPYDLL
jgi:DNA-binding Xre family transcriptional regulator